ncbi:hypothetical protein LO772_26385 [Yinghuangia sp. ASG 101]|uniref:hypothetical protein n=1 Tax=Yinghuangia sp. ASG 101 TaxID=2896848 RepID=UPI001E53FF08|nr:hypothetical protein [Yinghuangia sp. ASG 101]UGQ10363.1 hypothetical protein LO772_26385 [Yinghuangia sp. ASG 101]
MLELATALRLAGPDVAAALVGRFRTELIPTLAEFANLPAETVEKVLAAGGFDVAACLAEWPDGTHLEDLLLRAVRLGDPAASADIHARRGQFSVPGLAAAVSAHVADPSAEGWYARHGLVDQLRAEFRDDPAAAARSRFAALVYTAAVDSCAVAPFAVAVDLCVAVADRGTADDLRALAKEDLGHPELAAMLTRAADAPSPSAHLADLRPPEEWVDPEAVRAFMGVRTARGRRPEGAPTPPLDWELIRREHERAPLGEDGLAWLTAWDDCPEDLVRDALRGHPASVVRTAARITEAIVLAPELEDRPGEFARAMVRGLTEGTLAADRVFAEGRSAARTLAALPDTPAVEAALRDLFAPLGDDPHRWLTLYARLPRCTGPARELVAEVVANAKPVERWPRPLDAVFPATAPENTRALFLRLVAAMPDAVGIALAPYLDARAVQHLLVFHTVADAVRDAVVAAHGVPALVAYAAHYGLADAEVRWLLDHDEPAVNALLFAHARLDDAERVRILSGVRRDGGHERVGREVLDVLDGIHPGRHRARLTAGIAGGDPGVAEVIVRRLRITTDSGRLRLLAAVWGAYGPDAVRPLLDPRRLTAAIVTTVTGLLDAPDGLERLRAASAAADEPRRVVAYLERKTADAESRLRRARQEGMPLPWPELTAAARDARLPADMIMALFHEPGCPREFGLAALEAHVALDGLVVRHTVEWRHVLLDEGVLTPEDMLRHVTRPSRFLPMLVRGPRGRRTDEVAEPCGEARALTAGLLGDDTDAWAVAIRMFADFAGTLPELLATARAAVA